MSKEMSPFVQVETAKLREKLNRLYGASRNTGTRGALRHFQDLWDLKELAMIERQSLVTVPQSWMDEVEKHEQVRLQ